MATGGGIFYPEGSSGFERIFSATCVVSSGPGRVHRSKAAPFRVSASNFRFDGGGRVGTYSAAFQLAFFRRPRGHVHNLIG